MSGLSEEAEERLQSHYDFYYSRLKEIERQRGEVEKFEQWSNLILDCEDQDELKAMVFTESIRNESGTRRAPRKANVGS